MSGNGAVTLKFGGAGGAGKNPTLQGQHRRISQHLFTPGSLTQRGGGEQKKSESRSRQGGPLSPAQKINFLSPRGSVQRQRGSRMSQTQQKGGSQLGVANGQMAQHNLDLKSELKSTADDSGHGGLLKRTADPHQVRLDKMRRIERNLGLLRTERSPLQRTVGFAAQGSQGSQRNQQLVSSQDVAGGHYELVDKETVPIIIEDKDPHEFMSARTYFQDQMVTDKAFSQTIKEKIKIRKGACRQVSVAETRREMEKKRLIREADVVEHRYRRQIERRNRLMKELNHIRELNDVYKAIDGELLYGNNSNLGSQDSEMSFISNSKFEMTPKRTTVGKNFGDRTKSAMRNTMRSSSNLLLKKSTTKLQRPSTSAKNSPAVRQTLKLEKENNFSCSISQRSGSSYNSTYSTQSKLLRSISKLSVGELRAKLHDVESRMVQESVQTRRLKQVLERERTDSIDNQRKIARVRPDVRRFTEVSKKVDKVKYLEKCRKLIAYNTLHTWNRRIDEKHRQRGTLYDIRNGILQEEEETSNVLMADYYQKLKQLIEVKQGIKEVQSRAAQMREAQEREERLLTQKEHQFFLVDRLGLVMLLQKYCVDRKKRKREENKLELDILKKYFSNREIFNQQNEGKQMSPTKNASPSKTMKPKNQFEQMEERITKLKSYQEYYTQNWGILKNHNFDFNMIEFRFHELIANLRSKETTYEELVANTSSKRAISEGLVRQKNSLKLQFMIFSQYPRDSDKSNHDGKNLLEERISEQEQQMSLVIYNRDRLDVMFKKTSSYLSNIIVKSAHLIKNMTGKMKITYPVMLGDIFKKYASIEQAMVESGIGSPQSSSYSPSKKGSRMNLDSSGDQNVSKGIHGQSSSNFLRVPTSPKSKQQTRNVQQTSLQKCSQAGRFTSVSRTLFHDLKYLISLLHTELLSQKESGYLLGDEEELTVDDMEGSLAPPKTLFNINLSALMQDTKAGLALLAEQNPKSKRTVVVDMKKNIMMSPGRAPSVGTASKYGGTTAHGDDDLDEEFEYMLQGKAQLQKLEARRKKAVEKKVDNMEKRQYKMNTQLIEMFAKKELQFMNQYMKNSTTAINNGDKMNADDFQMNAEEKRTLIAGEWRIPQSDLNHMKQTNDNLFHPVNFRPKPTRNPSNLRSSDSQFSQDRSKATPLNPRLQTATSTMVLTARPNHGAGSVFSQARSLMNRSPSTASKLKVLGGATPGALISQEKKPTGALNLDLNVNHQGASQAQIQIKARRIQTAKNSARNNVAQQ